MRREGRAPQSLPDFCSKHNVKTKRCCHRRSWLAWFPANRGPVMVCNPVFNTFSPGLPQPDNFAIGQYDGGRRDRPDSRDRLSGRHYVRSDWSGHLDVGHASVGGRQGVHPTDSGWMGQMPIQHGQAFDSYGPSFVFPNLQQSHSSNRCQ